MPSALITSVTGQDGSCLAEFLLARGYEVHGTIRRASTFNTHRTEHLYRDPHDPEARLRPHYGDLTDSSGPGALHERVQPDEIYNLGAQSHVRVSFDQPEYTADVIALGTLRLLEANRVHQARTDRRVRFYQAGSSALAPQQVDHRVSLLACGPSRLVRASGCDHRCPSVSHVDLPHYRVSREIGCGGEAMWLMPQHPEPDDFVIATGASHSVRGFLVAVSSI
jgi:GDPmannose 4,6-dehydratase